MTSVSDLVKLRDKLKAYDNYRKTHRIEFIDWDKYPEQTDIVERVVNRVIKKVGPKIFVAFGGNRCLGPDQELYDPVKGTSRKVSDIKQSFSVYSWDGTNSIVAKANKPFIKGQDNMYRFEFSNGATIIATKNHRVLNNNQDYVPLSSFKSGEKFWGRIRLTGMFYLGKQDVWDFEVPTYHNYIIKGIVNHNSGKTEAGAACVTRVAEEVREARILCATVETKISINVQQRKLKEWLSQDKIADGDFNPKRGWKNSIIEGTNDYNILFKTYAQGFEAFQGDQFDLIWLDEESPYDIFQECLMRTADRNGALLFTFTSLQGFTRLVNRLWETSDPEVYTTLLDLYMNPYIDKASKDLLAKTIDPDEVASRIHGKPHMKEGLIYKEFGQIHKVERFDYNEMVVNNGARWELHDGIDPHERTPHHWLRFLYDRVNNIVYVVEELKAPQESMLINDFARLLKQRDMIHRGIRHKPLFTQIDTSSMKPEVSHVHSGEDQQDVHTIRNAFFKAGISTILCTKDNAIGINEVKTRLKVVRNADGIVKREPTIKVFSDLTGVCWEFTRYSWGAFSNSNTSEKKEMLNKPMKKDDHFMDIIKYECIKLKIEQDRQPIIPSKFEPLYPSIGY